MLNEKTSIFLIGSGAIFIIVGSIFFLANHPHIDLGSPIDAAKWGQFGDFISGLVGSLWALAGVILFYVALHDQREDIRINRKALHNQIENLKLQTIEFKDQKIELQESRKIYKEQSETAKQQRFENTFFNLLTLHHEIINSITFGTNEQWVKREFFKNCYIEYRRETRNEGIHPTDYSLLNEKYFTFFKKYQSELGNYFRNLYNIIKFVNESDIEDKHKYVNFLRAQLSNYELLMMFYNCHYSLGRAKFRPLIIEYSILKHVLEIKSELIIEVIDLSFYPTKAYDKNGDKTERIDLRI